MAKKSTKENKKIYQLVREELDLSRIAASDLSDGLISDSRIEKIEGDFNPRPDEVLLLSVIYNRPELCNYYCTKECEIGQNMFQKLKQYSTYHKSH